jgi:lipopolysaccharide/colanic/teichoic acid biosynthesis glycosyltransferase
MPSLKRVVDASIASCALLALSPVLVAAAIGIKWSSPGPILFRSRRIAIDRRRRGLGPQPGGRVPERRRPIYLGREFTIYKFRTMATMAVNAAQAAAPITAWKDSRIFPFGQWLRTTKIDELPQLLNVMKGEMALVGPRPEAPEIVRRHYTEADLDTLQVLPGLTSPGTLYYYTHCEEMLAGDAAEEIYVQSLLPLKLALDRVYLRNASLSYDLQLIARTILIIVARLFGTHQFPDPPELMEAEQSMSIRPA